jgi:beta-lactamase regulating signal transducer with metallopeptidase domain
MSPIAWIVVKATVMLGLAALVQVLLRRRASAAVRHLVWTSVAVSLLVLPVAVFLVPSWHVVVRTAAPVAVSTAGEAVDRTPMPVAAMDVEVAGGASAVASQPAVASSWASRLDAISWATALWVLYLAGVLVFSIRLIGQHLAVRRFARRASVETDADWKRLVADAAARLGIARPVGLLRSRELVIPSMFGIRRPTIVLPAIADAWPDDRRRVAIVHELAHVARLDCFTQGLAAAACALYWFHPGAWWLARRMRVERELACDDRVIAAGVAAREYADHLLEIAFSLGGGRVPALAAGMARPRELEGRLMAALDASRNRRVPASRFRAACFVCATVLVVPLAAATPTVAPSAVEQQAAPAVAAKVLADARPAPAPATEAAVADAAVAAHAAPRPSPVNVAVAASESLASRAVSMVAALAQDAAPGTWEIRPTGRAGFVHLRLVEPHSSSGEDVPVPRLEGLTDAQLTGPGGPVRFQITRDAGTFSFDGVLHNGVGAGTFSFAADPSFPEELARRGFARPTAREQDEMAREDIGFAFLDELTRQGYAKPVTADLVRAGEHGVNVRFLRDMDAAGYRVGSLGALITLRDHGVTGAYIRALQDAGYTNLPVDTVRRARDHGITADYMKGLRDAGYASLPIEALIRTRDHGVTPDYIHDLREAGYTKLPLDEVVRARDHGVSSDFVRGFRELGYAMPLDQLIRTRDHGVSPRFAQDLEALGYDHLTPDDLIMLRDHGLTAQRIRAANARAGTRLPLDMLRSLADGGGWR